jgi:hypothetical protein
MSADVDIDLPDRKRLLELIDHTCAAQTHMGAIRKHNSGIYVTDIPYDPINDCSALLYEDAEKRGYFKIDLLNVSVYQMIKDEVHYQEMLEQEPDWPRLWTDTEWASQLIHVGNYTDLLQTMKPDSVTRMAAFISIIRPGKYHLQNKSWGEVFESVWDGDKSHGFTFKKSHAISYAVLVRLHMNLLSQPVEQA